MSISRREFLRAAAGLTAAAAVAPLGRPWGAETAKTRPNVLVIFTDQEREMTDDRKAMKLPNRERL
ncbi:MAG: twin-arginine translocation signal domain-containing protein, partial [Candidatus Sumerlaeota bacterium]|nr:twin-arginine translocation signal domain-containing protein [Candidatus Sumerlaeota bacterium]